jgi:hypothetical protein
VALAAALAVTLVPRGLSSAAVAAGASLAAAPATAPNDGGITWTPDGTPVQSNNGSGDCETAMSGTVGGPAAAVAEVASVLSAEAPDPVNQDDIGTVRVSAPAAASGTSMTVYADAGVGCDAVNQADAYIRGAGYAGPAQFARALLGARAHPAGPDAQRAVLLAYGGLPAWLRTAIAAVTAAVVFAAVSVAVTAAIAALVTATGGAFAPAALALIPGCVAGLAAGPVGAAIATNGNLTVPQGLASALAGCFAGSVISATLGLTWIASTFQSLGWTGGTAITSLAGQAIAGDAAAAGASLGPAQVQLAAIVTAAGG